MKSSKIPFLLLWFDFPYKLARQQWAIASKLEKKSGNLTEKRICEPNLRKNFKSASVKISPNKSNKVNPIVLDARRVPKSLLQIMPSLALKADFKTDVTFMAPGTDCVTNIIIGEYFSSFHCLIKIVI